MNTTKTSNDYKSKPRRRRWDRLLSKFLTRLGQTKNPSESACKTGSQLPAFNVVVRRS